MGFRLDKSQVCMFGVQPKQRPDDLGARRIDDQFAALRIGMAVIAKRQGAAHPEPFLL